MSILLFIAVLAFLILVHEFGHFIVAKLSGIRVDEFAIGFPPRLLRVTYGETTYSLNLLLIGGFVRIAGETDGEGERDPRAFSHAPRYVQAAVAASGIIANIVAAWLLFSVVFMIGMPAVAGGVHDADVRDRHLTIVNVMVDSPAARAGLEAGDRVEGVETGLAALPVPAGAREARDFIGAHGEESMVVSVFRDGAMRTMVARPEVGVIAAEPDRKALGVEFAEVGTVRYAPPRALIEGARMTLNMTAATAVGLGSFFASIATGSADFSAVAGPVGIAKEGAAAASAGWGMLLWFAAVISINLALINVLPIPGLDGGRLLVTLIEAIRRKALPPRFHARFSMIGLSLLALLMVIVTWHDIARLL